MSVWADQAAHSPEFEWSRELHFTNTGECLQSLGSPLDPDCLLSGITHFAWVLLDEGDIWFPHPVTKEEALKMLVHLVGDLHAPFHIGDEIDLGGSNIKVFDPVECLLKGNRGSRKRPTLHNVWDTHILKIAEAKSGRHLYSMVDDYSESSRTASRRVRSGRRESLAELVKRTAKFSRDIMTSTGLHDERGRRIENGAYLTNEYFDKACPVAMYSLQVAGHNLAILLNTLTDVASRKDDDFVLV
jgi:hypothetical protein